MRRLFYRVSYIARARDPIFGGDPPSGRQWRGSPQRAVARLLGESLLCSRLGGSGLPQTAGLAGTTGELLLRSEHLSLCNAGVVGQPPQGATPGEGDR